MSSTSINMRQAASGTSLRDIMHVLFKHQARILTFFIVTVGTVAVASFLATPVYESQASLLIKIGREYIPQSAVGNADTRVMAVNQEEIINSEIAILNNREIIEKVIASIGLEIIYPKLAKSPASSMTPMDAAVTQFAKSLKAEGVKKSNVINVSFQHPDPVMATRALTVLIDFFKEKHLDIFSDPQSSFLEQQLADYQQRLDESASALDAFKQQNQIYSIDEQRSLLLRQKTDLDTALNQTRNHLGELQKKIGSYREQLRDIARSTSRYTQTERDKIIVEAQTRLLGLKLKEQELLAKDYRADGRMVGSVQQEIRLVQNFLKNQEEAIGQKVRTGNPVYQEIEKELLKTEAEFASRQAGAITLSQQLAQLAVRIQRIDQNENELRTLQRTLNTNEKNYLVYAEKFEEARISDDLNRQKIANISVIQAPVTSPQPITPKKRLNIILGMLFGALFGLGLAFFIESTSQSFSTPAQVERRLRLPVLASLTLKEV